MRTIHSLFFTLLFSLLFFTVSFAACEAADSWFWISSNDKYTKYFDTSSVVTTKQARSGEDWVPTEILAWTKTTYSIEGAKETIKNYRIKDQIPTPEKLSYSLAQVAVNPQNRSIQYLKENFYDVNGKVLWSKAEGREKEINSQEFDEDFFTAIVDVIFGMDEVKRRTAKDRWLSLWSRVDEKGKITSAADTTTMRLKGENLIFWVWEETKLTSGSTAQIRFMKKYVNVKSGTERFESGRVWTPSKGWQDFFDEMDGAYREIKKDSPEYAGLLRLRSYVQDHMSWVTRYRIASNIRQQ